MSQEWMSGAACREHLPSVFFPHDGAGVELAKQVCFRCPVRPECLQHALSNRIDHGVWGGCSERERRRIARRLREVSVLGGVHHQ